jgi:hypothetical protein
MLNPRLPNCWHAFMSPLVGLPLSRVWRSYGSAIFLEFGDLSPRLKHNGCEAHAAGEMSLMIEGSWRIEDHASVRCGSWSDEALWAEAFAALKGNRVSRVTTFGRLPEIEVSFINGLHVLSFITSEGHPAWTLFDRRGPQERWLCVGQEGLAIHPHD